MNTNNLLVQYDKDLRLRILYPDARREITGDVVRIIRQAPGMNFVSFTFANEQQLDRVIDCEVEYFAPMQQPFAWKAYEHDHLPSLKERLASHGFTSNDPCYIMTMEMDNFRLRTLPCDASIRRITEPADLQQVGFILHEALSGDGDSDQALDRLALYLEQRGYLSVYVAEADGKPASAVWTYFPRGHFASMSSGVTRPAYRRRGLYSSLLAVQLEEIRQRGYPFAVTRANALTKPILENQGFRHLTTVWEYAWRGN